VLGPETSKMLRLASENRLVTARELLVTAIVLGEVLLEGGRIQVNARLIGIPAGNEIWSSSVEAPVGNAIELQQGLLKQLVGAIAPGLDPDPVQGPRAEAGECSAVYDVYLRGKQLSKARHKTQAEMYNKGMELLREAVSTDETCALAWEAIATASLDMSMPGFAKAGAAARRALELNPELSMPYAVLAGPGMNPSPETGIDDLTEAERLLDLAVLKDPNNTTAWLWRGIHFNTLGYFDRAVADFDECLRRDPAYLNCVQHRAAALLFRGETDTALAALIPTLFENYHSMSEVFVPVLVEQGNSLAAVLIATAKLQLPYAPVGEWINALEHPDQDHRAGLARFDRWAAEYHYDYATDAPGILLAFGAFERAAQAPSLRFTVFGPDAKAFRKTGYFKQFVHDRGLEDYWRRHGFPPSCHVLDGQDFACN